MNEKSNLEIVKSGYEKFGTGDIPGLLSLFSDDIQWTLPEIDGVPHGGTRRGLQATGEFFRLLNEAEEITHFEPKEFISEGNNVVVLGEIKAKVRETGRGYESEWVHLFRVEDGKVVSFKEFFDSAAVSRAFQRSAAA